MQGGWGTLAQCAPKEKGSGHRPGRQRPGQGGARDGAGRGARDTPMWAQGLFSDKGAENGADGAFSRCCWKLVHTHVQAQQPGRGPSTPTCNQITWTWVSTPLGSASLQTRADGGAPPLLCALGSRPAPRRSLVGMQTNTQPRGGLHGPGAAVPRPPAEAGPGQRPGRGARSRITLGIPRFGRPWLTPRLASPACLGCLPKVGAFSSPDGYQAGMGASQDPWNSIAVCGLHPTCTPPAPHLPPGLDWSWPRTQGPAHSDLRCFPTALSCACPQRPGAPRHGPRAPGRSLACSGFWGGGCAAPCSRTAAGPPPRPPWRTPLGGCLCPHPDPDHLLLTAHPDPLDSMEGCRAKC